jgi:hypothetical protein
MAFEGLFAVGEDEKGKSVKIVDGKSVGFLGLKHNHPVRLTTVDDMVKYLRCMWAFSKFVRENRDLTLVKPLVFEAGSFRSNCYWWPMLFYTNRLCDLVLKSKTPSAVSVQNALSLAYRMKEVKWEDTSDNTDFQETVLGETKQLGVSYVRLRFTMFCVAAAAKEKEDDFEKAARMYASASQLDDMKDRNVWGKALLNKSLACYSFSQNGEAIVWAQQYENYMKGAVHPELAQWIKDNSDKSLPKIDTGVLPLHEAYIKGTPSEQDPILFVLE